MWQFLFAFPALGMASWAGESSLGGSPGWGEWDDGGFFFGHLLLPADKYQPAEVLEADVELVAPADLPPVCGVDIVCGKREFQPWNPPSHPAEMQPL